MVGSVRAAGAMFPLAVPTDRMNGRWADEVVLIVGSGVADPASRTVPQGRRNPIPRFALR